jgi:hypothetical protein
VSVANRSWVIVLGLVGGVVACSVATPSPDRPGGTSGSALRSPAPSAAAATSTPPAAWHEPAGELGREIQMGALDPAWTAATLEVASDGEAVIFSSGVADGPGAEGAPDLWRYLPGAAGPELLWQNPRRDRALVRIGGEFGTWAFVDTGIHGERAWDLWLLPEIGAEPILLDTHPGDEEVSSLVPSFAVHQGQIAWTAFDRGPDGPVSQLLYASAPVWEPVLVAERDASRAELWLPSLRDTELAYCEVSYSEDRSTDERHVYVTSVVTPDAAPNRLDTSGRATMPLLLLNGGVMWKEAEPGFSMFNWGHLFRYDEALGEVRSLPTRPQEFVNYPSAGTRFVAAWGVDSTAFGVYDLDLETARLIERYPSHGDEHILRPHISGDLLVWTYAVVDGLGHGPPPEIRYAFLPPAGSDRNRD